MTNRHIISKKGYDEITSFKGLIFIFFDYDIHFSTFAVARPFYLFGRIVRSEHFTYTPPTDWYTRKAFYKAPLDKKGKGPNWNRLHRVTLAMFADWRNTP